MIEVELRDFKIKYRDSSKIFLSNDVAKGERLRFYFYFFQKICNIIQNVMLTLLNAYILYLIEKKFVKEH